MEYNTGTMVASRHHGRKVVLNHCTQAKYADHIDQIEHTSYYSEQLFGEMPLSAHHLWWTQRKKVDHICERRPGTKINLYRPSPGREATTCKTCKCL